jgi:hypothetical protein
VDVQSFTTAGARQSNESFPTDAPWGIAHDGTSFLTLASGISAAKRRLTRHSNWVWTTESPTYWVAYTWRDSAGGYETSISPVASVTMKRRAYLTVTWPQRPNGTDQTRVYMNRGATQPATLRRQVTTSATSAQLDTFNSGGAAHPTSNTFPGAGHGAELRTSDGAPLIRADGMSRCRVAYSTSQNAANSTNTPLAFDAASVQVDTEGDPSSGTGYAQPANNRFRAPFAGQYLIQVGCQWAANATGLRRLFLQWSDDGTTWNAFTGEGARDDRLPVSGAATNQSFAVTLQLPAARYIRAAAFQNSGGTLAVNLWNLSVVFLGPA